LDQHHYHTAEFARKASVSVRTLRYYDKVGLLSPSQYTEAGHRLYSDHDLVNLQYILALKFLGFSLDEIRICLETGIQHLHRSLAMQKSMMREKQHQLTLIIQAIEEAEKTLSNDTNGWDEITHVIQVIQMEQKNDWRDKYLTPEQRQMMENLSKHSYTEADREKLAQRGKSWSEEDQQQATQQWNEINAELKRLVATGTAPTSPEAQAWAKVYRAQIERFTGGDASIETGLKRFYQNLGQMKASDRPIQMPYNKEEGAYIQQVMEIYRQQ